MNRGKFLKNIVLFVAAIVLLGSCRKREELGVTDNYIVFTSDAQGITESENSITINVKLTRGTDKEIPVVINLTEDGAIYGTDYTTTPAATAGVLNIVVPSGNNEASFTVNKVPGALFEGTEKIEFDLYSSGSPILIGTKKKFTLSFAELVATASTATINGGGVTFPNKVFIDLSANRQVEVQRTKWDLGFYSGDANDFKVVLNGSVGMMAKKINKNDLNQVTAADTVGLTTEVAYSSFAPTPSQMAYIDYPDGDLDKTAIGNISAVAGENEVFIVNRGFGIGTPAPERGWKKIRVLRNGTGGYTLQYADIAATTFSTIDIPKDETYFFKYVSFDNGIVTVEPEKAKWDIAWTYGGYLFNFGSEVPYLFQDLVLQNRNVEIAKVMEAATSYTSFSEANIVSQTFSSSQVTIGADWRGTQPTLSVKTDRYYIIKDGDNNYYKLKFTGITDGGVRGYPSIEYELVKRGG